MTDAVEKVNNDGLDFDKMKADIIETNKGMMDDLKESIMSSVKSTISEHAASLKQEPVRSSSNSSELDEDFAKLGVDAEQGNALIKIIDKHFTRRTDGLEDNVLKKVDQNLIANENVRTMAQETVMMFPDIKDKKSEFFRMSQKILKEMSPMARQSPEAEILAVERAALRLGIKPRSLSEANAWASQNPMGSGGDSPKKKKEISSDMAKYFNVDPKKVNEKLKEKGIL